MALERIKSPTGNTPDIDQNFDLIKNTFANPATLTTADAQTVDATYGNEERDVINNLRIRLNELETELKAKGLLE